MKAQNWVDGVDAHFNPPLDPVGLSIVLAFDNGQTNI